MEDHTSLYPQSAEYLRKLGYKFGVGLNLGHRLETLILQDGGYLGTFPVWMPLVFCLLVKVPRKLNSRVVSVHGRGRQIDIKSYDSAADTRYVLYNKRVRTRRTRLVTDDGWFVHSTKHEGNNLRIVLVRENLFQMWEVAIPARIFGDKANYFLTIQKLYEGHMYNDNGALIIPAYEYAGYQKWPDLQLLLLDMVDVRSLPGIHRIHPFVSESAEQKLAPHEAEVLFFCLASGLGIARTHFGWAGIHWREIISDALFSYVQKGQLVIYDECVWNGSYWQLKNIYPF